MLAATMAGVTRVLVVGIGAPEQAALNANLAQSQAFAPMGCASSLEAVARLPHDPAPQVIAFADEPRCFSAANAARARWPRARLVQTTLDPTPEGLFRAACRGADALLDVSDEVQAVRAAVHHVLDGHPPIREQIAGDAAVVGLLLDHVRGGRQNLGEARSTPESLSKPLSLRELQLLERAACGYGNKRIALDCGLSEQTIKNRFSAILSKLGAADRTEAVVCALRNGWIALDKSLPGGG